MCPAPPEAPEAGNIVLIGMPGVGKSTLGVLLAKHLRLGFVDTDLLIQTGERASLQEIIRANGIEAFCRIEGRYVQRLAIRDTVIATGGSVIFSQAAMDHLASLGRIVFLDIGLGPLAERLSSLDRRGVVMTPGQTLTQLYAQRRPFYQQHAQLTVQCTDQTPEQMVHKIIATLDSDKF